MKFNSLVSIGVCVFLVASRAVSFAGPVITEEDSRKEIESEGRDISRALNESAQEGKLAGEVGMEEPFVDNFSGGLAQEMDDTVRSQNELENKKY